MWTKNNIPDQSGRTAIVTGANTGIGFETALALYEAGAHVVLACHSEANAVAALERMQSIGGKGSLETGMLNLASLTDIRQFAEAFCDKKQRLDLLINNAGVMIPPPSKTEDGFELQFGVNFIGHFALTGRLYPLLNATPGARVVTVSSMAYTYVQSIDFDNLKMEHDYQPTREYGRSKLADILFGLELQRRIKAAGGQVISNVAQPGANNTDLSRYMSTEAYAAALERFGALMEPWQGALPSLYAAVTEEVLDGEMISPHEDGVRGYPVKMKLLPFALDEEMAGRLWDYAVSATGIQFP